MGAGMFRSRIVRQAMGVVALVLTIPVATACAAATTTAVTDADSSRAAPIPAEVLAKRRAALFENIAAGIAVIRGAEVRDSREHPQASDFRQDNNFYYFTGLEIPGSWLLMFGRETGTDSVALFVPAREPEQEVWRGRHLDIGEVARLTGIEPVFPVSELQSQFLEPLRLPVLGEFETLHLPMAGTAAPYRELVETALKSGRSISDLSPTLARLRLVKDSVEIERLRRAIEITAEAEREVMRAAHPGMYEYQLEAILEYVFRWLGAERVGFPSVVGSGPNSVVLHHDRNDRQTGDSDLVVMDAGAEFGYYTADLTRTFPINGVFTPRQREIYDLVLATQMTTIDSIQPGVTLLDLSRIARRHMRAHSGDRCGKKTCDIYFIHAIGHCVGMDVHDPGSFSTPLKPGMVLAIEPGIYLVDEELGIRIEDDVLVTEEGHEVLSAGLPRSAQEIEELMRQPSWTTSNH